MAVSFKSNVGSHSAAVSTVPCCVTLSIHVPGRCRLETETSPFESPQYFPVPGIGICLVIHSVWFVCTQSSSTKCLIKISFIPPVTKVRKEVAVSTKRTLFFLFLKIDLF